MKILVTGGTGTVGSEVVRELARRGAKVEVLTRNPAKAKDLPAGVRAVVGNLLEPATVRHVFDGADAVFLANPFGPTEASEGLMALNGMRAAGVRRVVYISVQNADAAAWLPHFGSKVGVEEGIKRSGIPYTILRPNNFFQNDHMLKDAILQYGVYAQPIGDVGLSRVDVRDVASAAAVALTSSGHEGETYDLAGPDVLTGEATARAWSEALNRPVVYGGNDLDVWERTSLQFLPAWMVFDLRMMYEYFQRHGLAATPRVLERQARLLGQAPRRFQAFARECAAAWACAA